MQELAGDTALATVSPACKRSTGSGREKPDGMLHEPGKRNILERAALLSVCA